VDVDESQRQGNNLKKAFIMGAVGRMCIEATRDLVKTSDFDEFLLADINESKLREMKNELRDHRVTVQKIDAMDEDGVTDAIDGYNIVVNGLPFNRIEPTVKACLKHGIPAIDLISPLDVMERYHEKFEKAGVLYSAGVGMTPGVTDIMAHYAVDQCNEVDEIHVYWAAYRPFAISPGLIMTTFWEMNPAEKERAYYEGGEYHPQPPMAEARTVTFEPPYGELSVYYVPHPETFTLSKIVPGVKKVETMGTWPPKVMNMLKQILDYGFFGKETIEYEGRKCETLDLLGHILHQVSGGTETTLWGYALRVEVIGKRDGRKAEHVLTHSHPPSEKWGGIRAYAKNVAIPLSIGAQSMADGRTEVDSGYHSAYEVYDPIEFFKELRRRGIQVHERVHEYHRVV
jgi:saccharopine dehydrogenase-like NADP-dependent oxidoreductase